MSMRRIHGFSSMPFICVSPSASIVAAVNRRIAAIILAVCVCQTSKAAAPRIDLADFARIVRYRGNTAESFEVSSMQRGQDPDVHRENAWPGEDNQFMIGVEWDE